MEDGRGQIMTVPIAGGVDPAGSAQGVPAISTKSVIALHVEDDENLSASLGIFLRSCGHRVVAAKDGDSALECVTIGKVVPDVLIVDYMLPGNMDGAEVAQSICDVLRRPIPIIMLSAALSNACMPWLPGAPLLCLWKPAEPEMLLKAVESFAELSRFMQSCPRQRPFG